MNKMTIYFTTFRWAHNDDYDIIGFFSSKKKAVKAILDSVDSISRWDKYKFNKEEIATALNDENIVIVNDEYVWEIAQHSIDKVIFNL